MSDKLADKKRKKEQSKILRKPGLIVGGMAFIQMMSVWVPQLSFCTHLGHNVNFIYAHPDNSHRWADEGSP